MAHGLQCLLSHREALCEAIHCRTEQASGRNRGVEESCFVSDLNLSQVEPKVALEDHQIGHCAPMVWAVALVVRKARSVVLLSSLKAPGSGPLVHVVELGLVYL